MTTDRPRSTAAAKSGLSRRTLFKAGGLAALATAAATGPARALTAPIAPARHGGSAYDVIVIGAGYAGVTAARELHNRGLRTLILEARNRIGGRTWTSTFHGVQIELGAQWLGPTQPLVHNELTKYGITTNAGGGAAPNRFIMPSNGGFATFPAATVDSRYGALMNQFFANAGTLFPQPTNPLYRADLVRQVDGMSLQDRLNQLNLSADDQSWISGTTAGYAGGTSSIGAYTALAQWWALAGNSMNGYENVTSERITGGMVALLTAMLNDSAAQLQLNTPVTSVYDTGSQVYVTAASGQVYQAPAVVVAVPVNVWKTMSFSPGLAAVRAQATAQGVGVPHSKKLWMHVTGLTDQVLARGAEGNTFTTLLSQDAVSDGQLMVAFNGLPVVDTTNLAAVNSAVQQMVPGAKVVDLVAQDWACDPYSLGGWALRRPGQLTTQLPGIQQPQGRVAFASGDIATGWVGFVEGAIESGMTAARQAATIVGAKTAKAA